MAIKEQVYIRNLEPKHKAMLEALSAKTGIRTAKKLLLFALESLDERDRDIARLERIIVLKQKKIERLQNEENGENVSQ